MISSLHYHSPFSLNFYHLSCIYQYLEVHMSIFKYLARFTVKHVAGYAG